MARPHAPAIDRVLRRVTQDGECWKWLGSIGSHGYGQISIALPSGRRSVALVHRISYESLVGPIPIGYQIDHLCRNRLCVRPVHLEAVTQRENILRSESPNAIAVRTGKCMRGHDKKPHEPCLECSRIRWASGIRTPEQIQAARDRARRSSNRRKAIDSHITEPITELENLR